MGPGTSLKTGNAANAANAARLQQQSQITATDKKGADAAPEAPPPPPAPDLKDVRSGARTLELGQQGDSVKWVQKRLGLEQTGLYDDNLAAAVAGHYARKGLGEKDGGKIDADTLRELTTSAHAGPSDAAKKLIGHETATAPSVEAQAAPPDANTVSAKDLQNQAAFRQTRRGQRAVTPQAAAAPAAAQSAPEHGAAHGTRGAAKAKAHANHAAAPHGEAHAATAGHGEAHATEGHGEAHGADHGGHSPGMLAAEATVLGAATKRTAHESVKQFRGNINAHGSLKVVAGGGVLGIAHAGLAITGAVHSVSDAIDKRAKAGESPEAAQAAVAASITAVGSVAYGFSATAGATKEVAEAGAHLLKATKSTALKAGGSALGKWGARAIPGLNAVILAGDLTWAGTVMADKSASRTKKWLAATSAAASAVACSSAWYPLIGTTASLAFSAISSGALLASNFF